MNKLIFTKSIQIYLTSILIAIVTFGGLQYLGMGKFSDPDGFYHAKAAQLLASGELHNTFPWLQYTTWKDGYADQHYIYHWLLVPFSSPQLLPLSIIIFGLIFVALFVVVLRRWQVSWPLFWLIIMLTGSTDFLFRINLVKANTISLIFLMIITLLLIKWHESRHWINLLWLSLISLLFTWTYGGFVFVPVLVGLYTIAVLVADRKIDYKPLLVISGGIIMGVISHPHGSHLWSLLYDQLFLTGLGAGHVVPAGNEWLAYNWDWFFHTNVPVMFAWLISAGIVIYSWSRGKVVSWQIIWVQLIALFLLFLTLWHRRFIEYFVPFAVIASAVSLSPYLIKISWPEVKKVLKLQSQLYIVILMVIAIVAGGGIYNVKKTVLAMRDGVSSELYEPAAEFMVQQSQTGDIIFNTQWDQFPQLFYWDSKNYYLVGLDPTFMYLENKDLYWQWRIVADDQEEKWHSVAELHRIISTDFHSKFLFVENDRNPNIINYLANTDPNGEYFVPSFISDSVTIYTVK
jgi:hypothetical protein